MRSLAQEFATNPELMQLTMRAQQAMQSGDPAAMMAIAGDPAMARVQQLMMANPALVQRLGGMGSGMPGMGGGMPGMGGAPGMGGMPGMAMPGGGFQTPTQPPRPAGTTPGAPRQAAQTPPAPSPMNPPPAPIPGAPSTQEEEERLLQEAIQLSMQEAKKKSDKPDEGGNGGGSA